MTINHIDQLTEWWENAEKGAPNKGDAIIRRTERLLLNGYAYEVGTEDYTDARHLDNVRILSRAPKPKPAWHDADAVIAHTADDRERRAMVKCGETRIGRGPVKTSWDDSAHGAVLAGPDLIDPVPLIEAKVTDEMVDRLEHHFVATQRASLPLGLAEKMLAAALGLETE